VRHPVVFGLPIIPSYLSQYSNFQYSIIPAFRFHHSIIPAFSFRYSNLPDLLSNLPVSLSQYSIIPLFHFHDSIFSVFSVHYSIIPLFHCSSISIPVFQCFVFPAHIATSYHSKIAISGH